MISGCGGAAEFSPEGEASYGGHGGKEGHRKRKGCGSDDTQGGRERPRPNRVARVIRALRVTPAATPARCCSRPCNCRTWPRDHPLLGQEPA
jgi:hypothetical protein